MEMAEERAERPKRESPYRAWQKNEGIPINAGSAVSDLKGLEVKPWPRTGQKGAFVNLAGQEHDDAYVLEIAPQGQTETLHHNFEILIYVLNGRGATSFWQPEGRKQTVEWGEGSVFSPPLNCYYQHFNLDGTAPARLFAVTNAPMVMNMYRSVDYVFNDPYVFKDRYDGEDNYFSDPGQRLNSNMWQTNFIPDMRSFKLDSRPGRGAGGFLTQFSLANNAMAAHCSEFPPGTYKKAHRHGVGAHVIILNGDGYSLLWFEGEKDRRKVDWKSGTVLSPKELEYHQHFNTGPTNARYLAFRLGDLDTTRAERIARSASGDEETELNGINYEDEDPEVYALYERECAKHGAEVKLPKPTYRR
jgi:hypothetical protein